MLAAKASQSSAAATVHASSRRTASASASAARPVPNELLLISEMPSLAARGMSPQMPYARSASGPRSLWPAEPSMRTRGVSSALSASTTRAEQLGAHARGALGEAVREPHHGRAHDLARSIRARAAMRWSREQAAVVGVHLAGAHAHALAHADAGRDAVDAGAVDDALDHVARSLHARDRIRRHLDALAAAGDAHDVSEREPLAIQDHGHRAASMSWWSSSPGRGYPIRSGPTRPSAAAYDGRRWCARSRPCAGR